MKNWLYRASDSVTLLVLTSAISVGGDVLLSFLWNSKLILKNPVLALSALGAVSIAGLAGGLVMAPFIARIRNQALFLSIGFALRMLAVACLAFASLAGDSFMLPVAAGVQVIDTVVTTLTAGAVTSLIANKASKEQFIQMQALNQSATRVAVLGAWLVGGFLLTYLSVFGMILVDVLSFVPLTLLLFAWSRHADSVSLFKGGITNPGNVDGAVSNRRLAFLVLPYTAVVLLGSLISRTTPMLWKEMFTYDLVPFDVLQGLLFAAFVGGFLGASMVLATKWGSTHMQGLLKTGRALPLFASLMGIAIALLPLVRFSAIVFFVTLLAVGFLSGLVPPCFSGKARMDLEGVPLRKTFYYMGLVGRFGEPVGSAMAGGLLFSLGITGLYLASGLGILLVSTVLVLEAATARKAVSQQEAG